MDSFKLKKVQYSTILGAGHGIGLALVRAILMESSESHVFASYREKNRAQSLLEMKKLYPNKLTLACVNPTKENSLESFYQVVAGKASQMDLMINCVGVLDDLVCHPEKILSKISMEALTHSFIINSAVTPVFAKTFLPLIRKSPLSLFSSISAKVGSIEDNYLGGWYGYRASKAALNMFIKNIAIEFSNRSIPCLALSIHPGTTKTALSEPYIKKSKLKIHSTSETASNILDVFEGKKLHNSGKFFSWDGTEIPW